MTSLPLMHGYKNSVSPLLIGSVSNLQMLPWQDNVSKHSKSGILLEELLIRANYTSDQSIKEFTTFLEMINNDIRSGTVVSGAALIERFNESKFRT